MKIGLIAGNFDVIHPGYIKMFDQMLKHCDHISVLLHTDPTIERPEKCKPILDIEERIEILYSLRQVENVQIYSLESELYELLKEFTELHNSKEFPVEVIRFLGDDYIDKPFTGDDLNIPIHYLNRDHGWSTTKYKQLIADSLCGTNLTDGSN